MISKKKFNTAPPNSITRDEYNQCYFVNKTKMCWIEVEKGESHGLILLFQADSGCEDYFANYC